MNGHDSKIYIRLIDGAETLVPVGAVSLNQDTYKIVDNPHLDIFGDITSIWEFFPGDVVRCEEQNSVLVANKLLDSSFPHRDVYAMIFLIVRSLGTVSSNDLKESGFDITQLCNNVDVPQINHPLVKNWISKYCV